MRVKIAKGEIKIQKIFDKVNPHHHQTMFHIMRLCALPLIDFIMRLTPPSIIEGLSESFDLKIQTLLIECLDVDPSEANDIIKQRFQLRAANHGFGMRNRERVKYDAFLGGLMAAIPRFVDRPGEHGVTIPGFFPELEGVYYDAENPIDYEQHPLRGFLSPVTGGPSPLAVEMQRVWTYLQDEHPDSASVCRW